MFVVLAAVHGTSAFIKDSTFLVAGERLTYRLREQVFASILRQDVQFFDSAVWHHPCAFGGFHWITMVQGKLWSGWSLLIVVGAVPTGFRFKG